MNGVTVPADTWTNFGSALTFSSTGGVCLLFVSGAAFSYGSYYASATRAVIDGTTSITLGGRADDSGGDNGNPFSGVNGVPLVLAAGTHTIQVQIYLRGASGTCYCRPAIPTEFFAVRVVEFS
jgi:hypothetical protein